MAMSSIDKSGELLIVCGLSGSGKSTLARHAIKAMPDAVRYLNTFTTRQRRSGEDELEYTFVSDDIYSQTKSAATAWDESVVYGNRYGVNAGAYIERMKYGENFIVCSVPDNEVVDEMKDIYSPDRVKTIHIQTNRFLSAERMRQRDQVVNIGRVAIDYAMQSNNFNADYLFNPSDSIDTDKEQFVKLTRRILA